MISALVSNIDMQVCKTPWERSLVVFSKGKGSTSSLSSCGQDLFYCNRELNDWRGEEWVKQKLKP